jgi:hypothetical protein
MSVPGFELVGVLGSIIGARRSLAKRYVDKLHLPGGGVSLGGKEAGRDGGSEKPRTEGLTYSVHPRPDGSDYGDLPNPSSIPTTPTDLRTLECGPGWARRPPLNKGCSVDARSEGGGYGRMSGYLTSTRVLDREKAKEMSGENPGAEARAPIFSMYVCLGRPPTYPRGDGVPRQGGLSRR